MLDACFIRVEVKKRELISRLDIAIEMSKRNIPVFIGEFYDGDELRALGVSRGYVFGKCAQPSSLEKFRGLADDGWVLGALDEEGLLPNSLDSFASLRFSEESAYRFSDIFFFGEAQKVAFERRYGRRESFIVSGNPRTDMWSANGYGIYDEVSKNIRSKHGDFVLFPLNFGYYTISSLRNKSRFGELKSENEGMSYRSEFLFDRFCRAAERIANDVGLNVVVRPHPADDPETIRQLMKRHGVRSEKVSMISDYDAYPWLSEAKAVLHNCCTTSIEAGLCGTPVFTFSPEDVSLYEDNEVNKLFPAALNEDELVDLILSAQNESFPLRDRFSTWGRLCLTYSGGIGEFIADQIVSRNNFSTNGELRKVRRSFDFLRLRNEFLSLVFRLGGDVQRATLLRKFPRTSLSEVQNIVERLCAHKGIVDVPAVTKVNSRLFHLGASG